MLSLQQMSLWTQNNALANAFPIESAALSLLSLRMQIPNESKMDAVREVGGSGREGLLLIGWNVSADCEVQGQSLLNDDV